MVTYVFPCETMAIIVMMKGPINFAFKADEVHLTVAKIFALFGPSDDATKQWDVILRAVKGAFSLSHRLALLKSTLKDTSLDAFGNAVGKLEFVRLSGHANRGLVV